MTKEHLISLLNSDLVNEYKHMHFYLFSSFVVQGLHRQELAEFLYDSAKSEMEHIKEFSHVIIGMGGVPICPYRSIPHLTNAKDILQYALDMENEVVSNYTQRIVDTNVLGGIEGKFIEIFLENQLLDSKNDAIHIEQMLKDLN